MNLEGFFPTSQPIFGLGGTLLATMIIWSFVWKGLALWKAARRSDGVWYVILMVINTMGILEMIYYFLIAKSDKKA